MFHKLPISKNLQLCASPNVHVLHCSNRDKVQILQNIEKKNPPKIPNNTFYEVTQTGRFFQILCPFRNYRTHTNISPVSSTVYIVERFLLQSGLYYKKLFWVAVSNQDRVMIDRVRYMNFSSRHDFCTMPLLLCCNFLGPETDLCCVRWLWADTSFYVLIKMATHFQEN